MASARSFVITPSALITSCVSYNVPVCVSFVSLCRRTCHASRLDGWISRQLLQLIGGFLRRRIVVDHPRGHQRINCMSFVSPPGPGVPCGLRIGGRQHFCGTRHRS
ncbi:hypothetical protein EDB85DRAFT_1978896 [Lactarius pseudohatsudake]|nr:hypothetical protein EDB85DRAFT_1978896 [Lactarius pseudohatsudake]